MTSLLPSNNENSLMLTMIDESMRLYGFQCILIDYKDLNLYEDNRELTHSYDYRILLQDYIDKRILANLSWQHIEKGEQGQVAFCPIQWGGKKFSLVEQMVIRLFNGDLWQIKEINRAYLVGLWFIVKLVPYVPEKNRPREEKQMKTQFLDPFRQEVF